MNWSKEWNRDSPNASGGFKKPDFDNPELNLIPRKVIAEALYKSDDTEAKWKKVNTLDSEGKPIGVDHASGPDRTMCQLRTRNAKGEWITCNAEIIGDLALEYADDGWEIYHVPTLTRFSKAVPNVIIHHEDCISNNQADYSKCTQTGCSESNIYDRSALLNWMKKVQENNRTAWTMLSCLTPDTFENNGESAKRIILEWCLSVKVE